MIDKVEFKRGIAAYWRALTREASAGVSIRSNEIPDYSAASLPEICKKAKMGGGIGSRCREFYDALTEETKCVLCPFGLTVQAGRLDCAEHKIVVSVILGRESAEVPEIVSKLKRYDRENAQKALKTEKKVGVRAPIPSTVFSEFIRFSECLSYGALALPIRGYAHELLSPIQGLLNDVMALKGGDPHLRDSLISNSNHISILAKKIQVIISGRVVVNSASLRKMFLFKIIENIANRHRERLAQRYIDIDIGYDGGLVKYVDFTPDLLELALSCVIENAIKYSFDGFSDKYNRISITFYQEEGIKFVKIVNAGCFITSDEIESGCIFELGRRGVYSGDMKRKGTGNGLFIVRQILDAHKGRITINSEIVPSSNTEPFANTSVVLEMPVYPKL